MGEAIEERGGHLRVAEHARPFAKGEIGGDDDRGALVETAGTNGGASILASALRRASRRQANNCWGVRPWRRATWQARTPSSKLSATIDAFSPAFQLRRRPAPVKISTRRAGASPSDTCLRSEIDMCRSPLPPRLSPPRPRRKRWDQNSALMSAVNPSGKRDRPLRRSV